MLLLNLILFSCATQKNNDINDLTILKNGDELTKENPIYKEINKINNKTLELMSLKKLPKKLIVKIEENPKGEYFSHYNMQDNILTLGYQKDTELNYKVYAHELTHFLVVNTNLLGSLTYSFIFQETFPDIISDYIVDFTKEKKMLQCENLFNRDSYDKLTFNDSLNYFQSFYYFREAKKCCNEVDNKFCNNFISAKEKERKLYSYPLEHDHNSKHYSGIPLKNFFNKLKRYPNILKKFIKYAPKINKKELKKSLMEFKSNELNILEKVEFSYYWDQYHLDKIDEFNI